MMFVNGTGSSPSNIHVSAHASMLHRMGVVWDFYGEIYAYRC